MILKPLLEAFSSIDATLTFLVIFGLTFLFTVQIIAWVTPPNPRFLHAIGIGLPIAALNTWAVYSYLPLAPSLIRAAMNGVYDNWGYVWVFSLVLLCMVFLMNAWTSWSSNRPLEVIQ